MFDTVLLHSILRSRYGPSGWWPGDSPFEVAVGAVLTQNTAWTNVEKAIGNLKAAGVLDLWAMHSLDHDTLASLIRPSGYYNIKAKRLRNLLDEIMRAGDRDLGAYFSRAAGSLRESLLGINGIGKETADSICCYAADKAIFVVDAYTKRILLRHGIIDGSATYDSIQRLFEEGLPRDLQIFKDLHAYLVFVGKEHCRPRGPRCGTCPLEHWSS